MRAGLIAILALLSGIAHAQVGDSVLTFDGFMQQVKASHPMVRQAGNIAQSGELEVMRARGDFDPKLGAGFKQKNFENKEYYTFNSYSLEIPTWFGVEAYVGADANSGDYLNPENATTSSGLMYAGLSLPLGQGLVIDQRRAKLKQAKVTARSAEAEARLTRNDLILDATEVYWQWYAAWQQLDVALEGEELAGRRFDATLKSARVGDLPYIDTLEAHIQLQNRQVAKKKAQLHWRQSTYILLTYLWNGESWNTDTALDWRPQKTPIQWSMSDLLSDTLTTIDSLNPWLQMQQYDIEVLEIKRKLKAEMLKPQLELKYTPLARQNAANPLSEWSVNNYTWGVQFSMPVFLRKERAELRQTDLKLENTELKFHLNKAKLSNDVLALIAEVRNLEQQLDLYRSNAESYRRLLQAELNKFSIGESSLFLINRREVSYLNTRMQIVQMELKRQQAIAKLKWVLGEE